MTRTGATSRSSSSQMSPDARGLPLITWEPNHQAQPLDRHGRVAVIAAEEKTANCRSLPLSLLSSGGRGGIMPLIQGREAGRRNPRVVGEDLQPIILRDQLLLAC